MKVVIFEYVSSGIHRPESLYPSLMQEADLMVNALGRGMVAAGCELVLFRSPSWPAPPFAATVIRLTAEDDWQAILEAELQRADAYIPIAPESGGLLESLCLKATRTHCVLLNAPAASVREMADKHHTLQRLRTCRIPCVACERINECTFPAPTDKIIKPNDGVACEHTFLIRAGTLPTPSQMQHAQIVQSYIQGESGSLSVIYDGDSKPCILGINRQSVVIDEYGGLHLNACHINALAHLDADFDGLAVAVQECFSGLIAYVGIDFVVSDGIPYVLELNPRMTTSFAGLAISTRVNPCAMLLAAFHGEPLQCPERKGFSPYTISLCE